MNVLQRAYNQNLLKSLCLFISVLCFSEIEAQYEFTNEEIFELPGTEYCTKALGNNSILDSIYEFKKIGYYNELYRWYYQYNAQQQPDSVWRYYFNGIGEMESIKEIRTYNAAGQLLNMTRKQPDFWALITTGDSTIIDTYSAENEYNNGDLVHRTVTEREINSEYVSYNAYYTYDDEHKIIHSTIERYSNTFSYEYYYTDEDDLEYILGFNLNVDEVYLSGITKYEYIKTDTTRQIIWNRIYNLGEQPILDTITHWYFMDRYYETYDQQGRRISLMLIQNNIYDGEQIDYRIEYSWTEDNQLLHASYYKWDSTQGSGVWEEIMRIDDTYDRYGNLLYYEKTYFDERSHSWEIEESKTYYYTYVTSGLPQNLNITEKLVLYPNPAEDIIRVMVPVDPQSCFTIYNLQGASVLRGKMENQPIDISVLKPGVYLVNIHNGHTISSAKFIKY